MVDSVLLRFRDHEAGIDTVEEHKKIIRRAGYAWWGWWRKESEPNRARELEELAGRAQQNSISIGLFDRSTDRFFTARATEFVRDMQRHGAPQKSRVPLYYRNSRSVEAWIKLLSIDHCTKAQFVGDFGAPPIGEHTFFPISPGFRPDELRPPDYIRLDSDVVVHISDLHFGGDHGFPRDNGMGQQTMLARLREDLQNVCGGRVGLVVVSGDLTSKADANALQIEGLNFLNALSRELGVPKEAILVIPGNHDFRLADYQPADFSHERPFNMMLREFYGAYDPNNRIHRFQFPSGHKAEFLLMNSVRLRKKEEANYGYVEWSLYESRLRAIEKDPEATRVAVLHHHLVSVPREELLDRDYPHAGLSTTVDSGAVIEGLQAHGFKLALHGHQHLPGIAHISRGIINGNNANVPQSNLTLLSAGSACKN